jgi:hypothetical protein
MLIAGKPVRLAGTVRMSCTYGDDVDGIEVLGESEVVMGTESDERRGADEMVEG